MSVRSDRSDRSNRSNGSNSSDRANRLDRSIRLPIRPISQISRIGQIDPIGKIDADKKADRFLDTESRQKMKPYTVRTQETEATETRARDDSQTQEPETTGTRVTDTIQRADRLMKVEGIHREQTATDRSDKTLERHTDNDKIDVEALCDRPALPKAYFHRSERHRVCLVYLHLTRCFSTRPWRGYLGRKIRDR